MPNLSKLEQLKLPKLYYKDIEFINEKIIAPEKNTSEINIQYSS